MKVMFPKKEEEGREYGREGGREGGRGGGKKGVYVGFAFDGANS